MQVIGHPRRHHPSPPITVRCAAERQAAPQEQELQKHTGQQTAPQSPPITQHNSQATVSGVQRVRWLTQLGSARCPHVAEGANQAGLLQACCSVQVHTQARLHRFPEATPTTQPHGVLPPSIISQHESTRLASSTRRAGLSACWNQP